MLVQLARAVAARSGEDPADLHGRLLQELCTTVCAYSVPARPCDAEWSSVRTRGFLRLPLMLLLWSCELRLMVPERHLLSYVCRDW